MSNQKTLPVLDMSCGACAVSVESRLQSTKGVISAAVNYANQSAAIEFNSDEVSLVDLQNAVRSIGYDLVITDDAQEVKDEARQQYYHTIKRNAIWSMVLSLLVVVIGMWFMDMPYGNYISMILTSFVVFYFGRSFFIHAVKQAKYGKANMDTLVALSTGIAFLFSTFNTFFPDYWHVRGLHAHVYFETAAVIITFIIFGKLLEERAKVKTSSALKKLMALQPLTTRIIVDGVEQEVSIASVKVDDMVMSRPGEKIAVDGIVVGGSSFVDESLVSGEPMAVEKTMGDKVIAGTINQQGSLQYKALKVGADTLLAQIITRVEKAQGSKAPVQKLVDKIAGIFVPTVLVLSVVTFIAWIIFANDNAFTHALLASITVLVIACPCALGLATPTAIMVGVGKGTENNILIKDAESLELARKVNTVIVDKTGTLTAGKPTVTNVVWAEGVDVEVVKHILYSLEINSAHPLADAVVKKLKEEGGKSLPVQQFQSVTARGVQGNVDGIEYFVGSRKMVETHGLQFSESMHETINEWQHDAKTLVYFFTQQHILAVIAIADSIRPTAKATIEKLQHQGMEVYMLTGDQLHTARAVAQTVGIQNFQAEMLPADKAMFIKKLQDSGKVVAMVGDGINDSEALAQADVSIAMDEGADLAMEVAHITLLRPDLNNVLSVFSLARKTMSCIQQNLFWAFIYNVIGIPLAAGILYPVNGFLLNPMIAGAAMALSSVSVVMNSLRLRWAKI